MDPADPVVAHCARGMAAEARGHDDAAREAFEAAWAAADDDYGACVAAHYLARHRPDGLRWHREALTRAERVDDGRVAMFLPSLRLNVALAADDPAVARTHFAAAARALDALPPGPYADGIRYAVVAGLRAIGEPPDAEADAALADLLAALLTRTDLPALALLLPAYAGNLGSADDRGRLVAALHMLLAARLPAAERPALTAAISALAGP